MDQSYSGMVDREEVSRCIDLCKACVRACERCANDMDERDANNAISGLCHKCIDLCQEAVLDLEIVADDAWDTCAECAVRCDICAEACEKIQNETCAACASVCRECAEQCRKVSAMLQQEEQREQSSKAEN